MRNDKESIGNRILWASLRLLLDFALILALVEGFGISYNFSYAVFADNPYVVGSEAVIEVSIPEGSNVFEVGTILEEQNIVANQYIFVARAYIGKYNAKILPGKYALSPGMTPEKICRTICGIKSEEVS